jgi:manganese oxidase
MRALPPVVLAGVLLALSAATRPRAPEVNLSLANERIRANDNRVPAGRLDDGVLTLDLVVKVGTWHPDGDSLPGVEMLALAEKGHAPQIPGPLIRVVEGTEIRVTIANPLPRGTLTVRGLYDRADAPSGDSAMFVPAGSSREIRFRASKAGTYYYWATMSAQMRVAFDTAGVQATAAFVVDPAGARVVEDRILILSGWAAGLDSNRRFVGPVVWSINGRAWPHTERFDHTVGDSVRLRIINASPAVHPVHLHGFYFRVDSRGDGRRDTLYASDSQRAMVFTERMPGASTASVTWVPERPGNWILHCHIVGHFMPHAPLGAGTKAAAPVRHVNHAIDGMGGLVLGFRIKARPGSVALAGEGPRRRLRLLVQSDTGGSATEPAFGYSLEGEGIPAPRRAGLLPGPTIVLRRGEPTSLMVVNRLAEPTAVHWHGIELESYFDGVAGFGGTPGRITPAVAPRDSFEARFTPPRSGTFIYHTHADEARQLRAGLSGALLVVEPGPYEPATETVVLISTSRRAAEFQVVLVNGSLTPAPVEWRVGVAQRIRLINIHVGRPSMRVSLLADSIPLTWRAVAKDAYDLPAARATNRSASQQISPGETYDFTFTPSAPGKLRLEVRPANGQILLGALPVNVRE